MRTSQTWSHWHLGTWMTLSFDKLWFRHRDMVDKNQTTLICHVPLPISPNTATQAHYKAHYRHDCYLGTWMKLSFDKLWFRHRDMGDKSQKTLICCVPIPISPNTLRLTTRSTISVSHHECDLGSSALISFNFGTETWEIRIKRLLFAMSLCRFLNTVRQIGQIR